jgi:hypothetical protein
MSEISGASRHIPVKKSLKFKPPQCNTSPSTLVYDEKKIFIFGNTYTTVITVAV